MISGVTDKEGWAWPIKDLKCWNWLQMEKDLPQKIANNCTSRKVMVQAGGNCGFYPKLYADMFELVYTFEPDPLNFYCLTLNVGENPNVYKQQACLGSERKLVNLTDSMKNIGAYSIDNKNFNMGKIPTFLLDDLALEICDLIHLDIEGWEFPALKGAINTIKKCRPVIALEWMDHGAKFGWPQSDIEAWLKNLGYDRSIKIMNEMVFFPS